MKRAGEWLLVILLIATTCGVDEAPVYDRTHMCNGDLPNDTCGSTRQGEPMTCYKARQIGVRDFCTESCLEGEANASGPGWKCVDTRARMRTCKPSEGKQACAQPNTECLRTDAVLDEGVCLTMNTCAADTDCKNPSRPTCIGSLLAAWYGRASGIKPDHFSCLQLGCKARLSACEPGETCLPTVIAPESAPMDICVPNCDADLNCPPNYFCARKVSSAATPAVCIPGIMGFRCTTDMDCLLGKCRDTGDGFKLCAVPCQTHDDCLRFGVTRSPFMCAPDVSGQGKYCQNHRAFTGSPCRNEADCRPHEICEWESPYLRTMDIGECRARCGPDQPCVNRAGMPHVCLELTPGQRGCYPGSFSIPCQTDDNCSGTLKCLQLTYLGKGDQPVSGQRCSRPCQTDEDCLRDAFVDSNGMCYQGACILKRVTGGLCEADRHCLRSACAPSPDPDDRARGLKRCK